MIFRKKPIAVFGALRAAETIPRIVFEVSRMDRGGRHPPRRWVGRLRGWWSGAGGRLRGWGSGAGNSPSQNPHFLKESHVFGTPNLKKRPCGAKKSGPAGLFGGFFALRAAKGRAETPGFSFGLSSQGRRRRPFISYLLYIACASPHPPMESY